VTFPPFKESAQSQFSINYYSLRTPFHFKLDFGNNLALPNSFKVGLVSYNSIKLGFASGGGSARLEFKSGISS
jgi:hypothetical protein